MTNLDALWDLTNGRTSTHKPDLITLSIILSGAAGESLPPDKAVEALRDWSTETAERKHGNKPTG